MGEGSNNYQKSQTVEEPKILKSLRSERGFIDEANERKFNVVRLTGDFKHDGNKQRKYEIKIIYIAGSTDYNEVIYFETKPVYYQNMDPNFVAEKVMNPTIDTIARRLRGKDGIRGAVVNALYANL